MNKLSAFLILITLFVSCSEKKSSDCACTEVYVSIPITFTDKDGKGVNVMDFTVINQRTGEKITSSAGITADVIPGYYFVIADSEKSKVAKNGDDLKISGTYEPTGQTKSAIIKVGHSDVCSCHIQKISGPDKITFD